MQNIPEFAEEYTPAERIRLVLVYLLLGGAIVATGKRWLFPWMGQFFVSAPCLSIFGVNGTTVSFYGLFVGLPLFCMIVTLTTLGYRGYKILRDGQAPPAGEKVFRTTRIERGAQAKRRGYMHVLAAVPFAALALWGSLEAGEIEHSVHLKPVSCEKERVEKG